MSLRKARFAAADIDLKPTEQMASNAARGLELREKHGKGGTAVGVARARDIKNRANLSPSTVRRMHSFFSRHAGNEKGGEDDAGYIAFMLWGGAAGREWAEGKSAQLDKSESARFAEGYKGFVDPWAMMSPEDRRMAGKLQIAALRAMPSSPRQREIRGQLMAILAKYGLDKQPEDRMARFSAHSIKLPKGKRRLNIDEATAALAQMGYRLGNIRFDPKVGGSVYKVTQPNGAVSDMTAKQITDMVYKATSARARFGQVSAMLAQIEAQATEQRDLAKSNLRKLAAKIADIDHTREEWDRYVRVAKSLGYTESQIAGFSRRGAKAAFADASAMASFLRFLDYAGTAIAKNNLPLARDFYGQATKMITAHPDLNRAGSSTRERWLDIGERITKARGFSRAGARAAFAANNVDLWNFLAKSDFIIARQNADNLANLKKYASKALTLPDFTPPAMQQHGPSLHTMAKDILADIKNWEQAVYRYKNRAPWEMSRAGAKAAFAHPSWSAGLLGKETAPQLAAYSWIDNHLGINGRRTQMLLADIAAEVHARNPSLSVQQAILKAAQEMVQKGVATYDIHALVENRGWMSRSGAKAAFAHWTQNTKVVESHSWVNTKTGASVSGAGALPWRTPSERNDWVQKPYFVFMDTTNGSTFGTRYKSQSEAQSALDKARRAHDQEMAKYAPKPSMFRAGAKAAMATQTNDSFTVQLRWNGIGAPQHRVTFKTLAQAEKEAERLHALYGSFGNPEFPTMKGVVEIEVYDAKQPWKNRTVRWFASRAGAKAVNAADNAVSRKIATLVREGYDQKQAIAIAYDMKRRGEL